MPHAARAKNLACSAVLVVVIASSVEGVGHPDVHRDATTDRRPDVFGGYASTHIVVKFRREVCGTDFLRRRRGPPGKPAPRSADPQETADWGLGIGDWGLTDNPQSAIDNRQFQLSPALQAASARWKVTRMRRAYSYQFKNPQVAARYGLDRTYIIEVPPGTDTVAMAAAFAAFEDEIEVAEVDGIGGVAEGFIPDDSDFWRQWGMHNTGQSSDGSAGTPDADIDAPEAWKLHTGNYGTVTVAIVDSGVDPHPEFEDRMVPGINTDNPRTPDLIRDDCPHGTHVAGIVAAEGNNGVGVAGVTWGANIMPVRVLGTPDGCSGSELAAAAGVIWAVDNGADIINMSLQYCSGIEAFRDAVDYAHAHGVLVVSAAGNNNWCGSSAVTYPARFANSMAVSATTDDDRLASHFTTACGCWSSNYGNELDVCAPGDRIWSTWERWVCVGGTNEGDFCFNDLYCSGGTCTGRLFTYGFRSGTSMATPHVSGLATLIKSWVPELTHLEIRDVITSTADDLGPQGWDSWYGYGRINARRALLAAGPTRIVASSPPDGAIDGRQPSHPDGSSETGWEWVDLTIAGNTSELAIDDFAVTQEGGVAGTPSVADVFPFDELDHVVRVVLSAPISVGAWTTIEHIDSGTSVRLGYLPADVNGDGAGSTDDILTLIDALDGSIDSPPIWSIDIDRSGTANPADILREIDLLNGADSYEPFLGAMLPPLP